jgi:ATP-dependent DNA ligase
MHVKRAADKMSQERPFVPFIPPMMCSRLAGLTDLRDPQRYIAEPKLDGQRGQLHIDRRRAVHC